MRRVCARSDPSMHVLGDILQRNPTIVELELMHNMITHVGAEHLARAYVPRALCSMLLSPLVSVGECVDRFLSLSLLDSLLGRGWLSLS